MLKKRVLLDTENVANRDLQWRNPNRVIPVDIPRQIDEIVPVLLRFNALKREHEKRLNRKCFRNDAWPGKPVPLGGYRFQ